VVTETGLTNLIEVVTEAGLTNLIEVVTEAGLTVFYNVSLFSYRFKKKKVFSDGLSVLYFYSTIYKCVYYE
jgi:hypothetical protein